MNQGNGTNVNLKIIVIVIAVVILVCLTIGLVIAANLVKERKNSNVSNENGTYQKKNKSGKEESNEIYFDCMEELTSDTTLEQANQIIGKEGELTEEKETVKTYYWDLKDGLGIEIVYNTLPSGTIKATTKLDYDRNLLSNSKVDFSRYDELQQKIKGGATYDVIKEYLGDVDGIKVEDDSFTEDFIWVNNDGGYIKVSFYKTSKKSIVATGTIK